MVTMAVAAGRLATLNPCLLGLNRLRPAELWQHIAPRQSMSQVHSYYPFCTGLYVLVLPEVIAEQIYHIYTLFVHGVATTMQVCSLNMPCLNTDERLTHLLPVV
jgi:cytochrome c biogenesis protein CcdA